MVINFAALGIGGFLMDKGPSSAWYANPGSSSMDTSRLGFWCSMDDHYDLFFNLYGLCMEICSITKYPADIIFIAMGFKCHVESHFF